MMYEYSLHKNNRNTFFYEKNLLKKVNAIGIRLNPFLKKLIRNEINCTSNQINDKNINYGFCFVYELPVL